MITVELTEDERESLLHAVERVTDESYDWQLRTPDLEELQAFWDTLVAKLGGEPIDWEGNDECD